MKSTPSGEWTGNAVDATQEAAIGKCIAYLGVYMKN